MSSLRKHHAKWRIDERIRKHASHYWLWAGHYWRLIDAIRAKSTLLSPHVHRGATEPKDIDRIACACARLAKCQERWQHGPETWSCPAESLRVQLRSLIQHLLDAYPVPDFMAPVWLRDAYLPWELDMYLHLAAGHSIRRFQLPYLPLRLTKAAARWFMLAPDDLLPIEAFRWAQVRSLGGDEELARTLTTRTALRTPTEDEPFWETVIAFLIDQGSIAQEEVVAIVRFIDQQRFLPADRVWGPGAGEQPVQPEFTIKNRTLRSLRRHMANWRTDMLEKFEQLTKREAKPWQPSSIQPFQSEEENGVWTIQEILTERELRAEGGIMRHCTATYVLQCARRQTTIWSMKVDDGQRRKRVVTIEVLPDSKLIWQARGKHNSRPNEQATRILRRWAEREALDCSRLA